MADRLSRRIKQRSPREWAFRSGIAAITLVLGYLSTTQTLAFVVEKSNTERAYAMSPNDGRIAARLAEQLSTGQTDAAKRARANRLANAALINEPLAVPALTVLGLSTQLNGDTPHARRLFAHSDALSQRELGSRLWLIEDAVSQGSVPEALHHYDIALRTSRNSPELLFPVLAGAVNDPAIIPALADTLAKRPPWGESFVNYLAGSGVAPKASAVLFHQLSQRGIAVPTAAEAVAVNTLVGVNAFDDAWAYYRTLRPGANRRFSRDPNFSSQLETPSVFDWIPLMNAAGVSASVQYARDGGVFDFAAPSTVGSVVLQQIQLLPPGRYRIEGVSAGIQQSSAARPYWQLSCFNERELGRLELSNSSDNNGRFSGEFVVRNCTAQTLRLVSRPSPEIGGVTGQIKRVALVPVGLDK